MVWSVDGVVGMVVVGRHPEAKIEFRNTVGGSKTYSTTAVTSLFNCGLEFEARELYMRTIHHNDKGPTQFIAADVAALYRVGMKTEAMHLFKRTIRGAKKLDMPSVKTLFDLGLVAEARDLLRRTAHHVTDDEYRALSALRKKVTCTAFTERRVSRAFRP
jgi:hypothetical protein